MNQNFYAINSKTGRIVGTAKYLKYWYDYARAAKADLVIISLRTGKACNVYSSGLLSKRSNWFLPSIAQCSSVVEMAYNDGFSSEDIKKYFGKLVILNKAS